MGIAGIVGVRCPGIIPVPPLLARTVEMTKTRRWGQLGDGDPTSDLEIFHSTTHTKGTQPEVRPLPQAHNASWFRYRAYAVTITGSNGNSNPGNDVDCCLSSRAFLGRAVGGEDHHIPSPVANIGTETRSLSQALFQCRHPVNVNILMTMTTTIS